MITPWWNRNDHVREFVRRGNRRDVRSVEGDRDNRKGRRIGARAAQSHAAGPRPTAIDSWKTDRRALGRPSEGNVARALPRIEPGQVGRRVAIQLGGDVRVRSTSQKHAGSASDRTQDGASDQADQDGRTVHERGLAERNAVVTGVSRTMSGTLSAASV